MAMARLALRHRREQLDLSQEKVAQLLGVSTTAYRDWELGVSTPRVGRRTQLAKVLHWSLSQLGEVLDQPTTDAQAPDGHAVPTWLGHLASLEQGASDIQAFEPVVVHGLLQTRAYATAVESVGTTPYRAEEVARRVESRIARQRVLIRHPDPLRLGVVLDESVLYRRAGDDDVMAGQLGHLAEVAERPNVDLRILPLTSGVFSAAFGAFMVLTSPGSSEPYMACVEDRAGPHYLDRPNEIEAHTLLFQHLLEYAMSPDASTTLITATKERHE
jgi:transcriptional regulator with XRE-family HTH domain